MVKPPSDAIGDWVDSSSSSSPPPFLHCSFTRVTCDAGSWVVSLNITSVGLSSYIPLKIGLLRDLVNLMLTIDNLTGTLPPELGSPTSLRFLNLSRIFPSKVLPAITQLEELHLSNDKFTGPLSLEMAGLKKLKWLDLAGNYFTGKILELIAAFLLVSAVPFAYLIALELSPPSTHVFHYHGSGFLRECAKWDAPGRRFLVSFFEGGVGQVPVPDDHSPSSAAVLEETTVIKDADVAGNASLGLAVDAGRERLLVAVGDVFWNKYSALAAYDMSTWKRTFLTQLGGPSDGKTFADDIALDPEGNAYVTDAKGNKIWKVGPDGELLSIIRSPLFIPKGWYRNWVGLNGIAYHPDGYLIVVHTFSGKLFKIDVTNGGEEVKVIDVLGGPLRMGDGLELLSPTKLVVAGKPSGTLVESLDGWQSASVVGRFKGPSHRVATAATVKDGKVYLNHMFGLGYPKKKHALVEAVFST
ncbi:hypothetical protein EUGRSUZ_H01012 [Eucalyptus grandis]|uniref:Uncharacterized protein n=2 Tax=Eucalyptus grandis TaxID=71139 RepID=A0ACC3JMS6_EUCGR|nr:hypothetical protein EUGRSUZ_H01012 [Eucalyptus grandis]